MRRWPPPRRRRPWRPAGRTGTPARGGPPRPVPRARRETSPGSPHEFHAGEVLLAATEHQPGAAQQVTLRGDLVRVLDPLVVQVGATLTDGPAGLALAARQPRRDQQVNDRRQPVAPAQLGGAGLPQRGRERACLEVAERTAAEQRRGGRLDAPGLLGPVHERGDVLGQRLLTRAQERLLGRLLLEPLDLLVVEERERAQQLPDLLVLDVEPELVEGVRREHLRVQPEGTALGLPVLRAVRTGDQ